MGHSLYWGFCKAESKLGILNEFRGLWDVGACGLECGLGWLWRGGDAWVGEPGLDSSPGSFAWQKLKQVEFIAAAKGIG